MAHFCLSIASNNLGFHKIVVPSVHLLIGTEDTNCRDDHTIVNYEWDYTISVIGSYDPLIDVVDID